MTQARWARRPGLNYRRMQETKLPNEGDGINRTIVGETWSLI
ncbi:hypothetical protein SAMN02745166_00375 [Prosthecobacter debontii]|uniref:Uncharacterized protein n=1 Tax=Prosthecobacter debontii TaxID=48467 RepID=A0A1T4WJ97_9BACT|nr:hypothetical protein SAMN02745166_00375 [Prosthecobacter debontii]